MRGVESLSLPHIPPPGTVDRIPVRALYLEGQLDPKEFRTKHPRYPVLDPDPLVIEPVHGAFVAITKFGALVFWNCPEDVERELLASVGAETGRMTEPQHEEKIEVQVGQLENRVTFDEVALKKLNLEQLKIISMALAQSVAMDRIETEVAEALRRFSPVVSELRSQGALHLAERDVLKAVGFALAVRQEVLANLTLFDKPPGTWESEALDRLDTQLYGFFDLDERLAAINQKVAYFGEMNAALLNLLNHRKSVRLEWTIIVLIVIEVVLFLAMEWRP